MTTGHREEACRNTAQADETTVKGVARAVVASMRDDRATWTAVTNLLLARRGRPPTEERQDGSSTQDMVEPIEGFFSTIETIVHAVLTESICDHAGHLADIRQFFVEPKETYSIPELSSLWRISTDDVRHVLHDEIAEWSEVNGWEGFETNKAPQFTWRTAVQATTAFGLLRPITIERALAQDFAAARGERWRTAPILIHLPRFVADEFRIDPSIPPHLALAHRIEQVLMEFFSDDDLR